MENFKVMKTLTKDEIAEALYAKNLTPSKSAIERVAAYVGDFSSYTDSDWMYIYAAIDAACIQEHEIKSIEDLAKYNEYIAEFVLEGDYCKHYAVVEDPTGSDVGAMLEDTLHRIIERVTPEKQEECIYSILGARKDDMLDINIDLGYSIPSILSWNVIIPEKKYNWKIVASDNMTEYTSIYKFFGTATECANKMKSFILLEIAESDFVENVFCDVDELEGHISFATGQTIDIRCIREENIVDIDCRDGLSKFSHFGEIPRRILSNDIKKIKEEFKND